MIDINSETLIGLRDAAKGLPPARQGRPVSFQCLLRWVLDGARDPHGHKVRLEAIRLGGRYVTSKEALQRFAERLTPSANDRPPEPTVKQRSRRAENAKRELEKMGV